METSDKNIVSAQKIRNITIRSFVIFFSLLALAFWGWKWLNQQPKDNGMLKPLRTVLNANESFFSHSIYSPSNLSRPFSLAKVEPRTRVNGDAGMSNQFDASSWMLRVIRKPGDTLFITLDEIKALPKTEIIFDFKCIEGWSQVTHWGGVRFSDFVKKYNLSKESDMLYVGLNTPDKQYYVGIDRKSILHPQTILSYEMNAQPLPMNQGYPLRLIIPVKYGIKHLKRIGSIFFSNERPPDYWYERGYDYYAGL